MAERPSMWSMVQRANWIKTAACPNCPEINTPGRKPLIELTDAGAWCGACGIEFEVKRPAVEVVK